MYARYNIHVLSRLSTPLQSDTIFGHLCWGIRYLKGEAELNKFLAKCEDKPPLLISSAFPKDCLPMPIISASKRKNVKEEAKKCGKDESEDGENVQQQIYLGLKKIKKVRKMKYLPINLWKQLREGLNDVSLIRLLLKEKQKVIKATEIRAHNSISRITGTVSEHGGFYHSKELWFARESNVLDIYCWFESDEIKKLWEEVWHDYIQATGFGKDKSTGAGCLELIEDTNFEESLFSIDSPNAWLNLSMYASNSSFEQNSCYKPFLKTGKLGGEYAVHGPDGGKADPFKKPIIMLQPGSVFFGNNPPSGELISNVHSDNRIKHSGLAICLPFVYGGNQQ